MLEEVRAGAARIERVVGTTVGGRRFMDLAYADLGEGVTASACTAARCSRRCAAPRSAPARRVLAGAEVVQRRRMHELVDAGGATYGPYDLIVGADGARSTMRRFLGGARARSTSTAGARCGASSRTRRTPSTACSTSTSTARGGWRASCRPAPDAVSLFWSIRLDRHRGAAGGRACRRSATICCRWRRSRSRSWPACGRSTQLLPAAYRQVSLRALARRHARAARRRRARAQPAARPGREPRADGRRGAGRRAVARRVRARAAPRRRASTRSERGR